MRVLNKEIYEKIYKLTKVSRKYLFQIIEDCKDYDGDYSFQFLINPKYHFEEICCFYFSNSILGKLKREGLLEKDYAEDFYGYRGDKYIIYRLSPFIRHLDFNKYKWYVQNREEIRLLDQIHEYDDICDIEDWTGKFQQDSKKVLAENRKRQIVAKQKFKKNDVVCSVINEKKIIGKIINLYPIRACVLIGDDKKINIPYNWLFHDVDACLKEYKRNGFHKEYEEARNEWLKFKNERKKEIQDGTFRGKSIDMPDTYVYGYVSDKGIGIKISEADGTSYRILRETLQVMKEGEWVDALNRQQLVLQ